MKPTQAVYCEGCGQLVDLTSGDYIKLNTINLDFNYPKAEFPVLNFDFASSPDDIRVVHTMNCFQQAAQKAYNGLVDAARAAAQAQP